MTDTAAQDGWKEVGMKELETPEGYVGNLTPEHADKLREMWAAFFDCCDRASGGAAKEGGSGWQGSEEKDPTKLGIPQDDAAKEEAKKRMEEQGMKDLLHTYGSEALKDTFWSFNKADNPDTNLLRFLRARKWDVSRAMAMLATCLKWRLDSGVEHVATQGDLGNGEEIPKFLDQQRTRKIYAHGCTKNEQPVCYVEMKKHLTFGQPGSTMQKFVIFQMETWRLFMIPPQDKMVILFDLNGFGIRNMDWVSLLYVVKCLEAYFPESLGTMYIHRGPWIFFQAWKLVKGLLDPVVRSKIAFTQKPEDLTGNIPPERLVSIMGGDVENQFEWIEPAAEENDKLKDTATKDRLWKRHRALTREYEGVTRMWIRAGGDEKDALLAEKRRVLVKKLRVSQFDLEPYVRGATVHHRNGTLPRGNPGIVRWQYELKSGDNIRQIVGHSQSRKSLVRELVEISNGSSVSDAEAQTRKIIEGGAWGRWDTCEDLPEEVKSRVDALLEPSDLLAAANADAAAPTQEAREPQDSNAPTAADQNHESASTATLDSNAAAVAHSPAQATVPQSTASEKVAPPESVKRQSMFGSIKSKLVS
ncbi:Phosphatidylinositol transfer protein PDR16 and related proteins [Ceraceosorus bombacis]|uniref:Phosphatidylinositol transfer protein PDR16 and related proteins n=1 Tax=Ceraceosorus bombacis TaxID=401625 RepID=A0A0P1BD91_9BASI|nr:Phosphatidylinositol transfer protein PDR16 and related proteins [Ceraceosorus bombacis]